MAHVRLVVKNETRKAIQRLRGPIFGTTEDAVVRKLIDIANANLALLSLDKTRGAPPTLGSQSAGSHAPQA